MVARMCMFAFVLIGSCCSVQSLWLTISMVIVCASSLAAILAQWMASKVVMCPWDMLGLFHSTWRIWHGLGNQILCPGHGVSYIV